MAKRSRQRDRYVILLHLRGARNRPGPNQPHLSDPAYPAPAALNQATILARSSGSMNDTLAGGMAVLSPACR